MKMCPFPVTLLRKRKVYEGEDAGNLKEDVEFGGWRGGEIFPKGQWRGSENGCVDTLTLKL